MAFSSSFILISFSDTVISTIDLDKQSSIRSGPIEIEKYANTKISLLPSWESSANNNEIGPENLETIGEAAKWEH